MKNSKIIIISLISLFFISSLTMSFINSKDEKSKVIELTSVNFEETIKKGITLVDFWAVWCGPCRMQSPIIDKLSQEIGDKAKIAKVNVDNSKDISQKYNISAIPTILIFKDGKLVKTLVGLQQKENLEKEINALLN